MRSSVGGALPSTGRVEAVRRHVGQDGVRQRAPSAGFATWGQSGDRPQPRHAGEARVGPVLLFELPDARVGFGPSGLDGAHRDFHRVPVVAIEAAGLARCGKKLQGLTERVELELSVDPVAHAIRRARVADRTVEGMLVGDSTAVGPVGRPQLRSVGEQTLGDEAHRGIDQAVVAVGRSGDAGVGLIADPRVPVVVVAAFTRAFGKAGRRGCHHRPAGTGETRQYRDRLLGVSNGEDAVVEGGHRLVPRGPGGLPEPIGHGILGRQGPVGHLQDEVVVLAGLRTSSQTRGPDPARWASAAPDQRNCSGPLRPVHTPAWRRVWSIR